jgi:hypothetical protein
MKQLRMKAMMGLIVALAVAAVAAPVAQAGTEARSEQSQVVPTVSSFYSSPAYHALMVRSEAMNAWYSNHSTAVRHADDRAGIRGPGITQTPQVVLSTSRGFDWGDASLGAGAALIVVIVVGGVALSRRNRKEPVVV